MRAMAREDFQQRPSSLPSPGEDLWTAGSPHLQHSEEAERAVLASVLLEPSFWPRVEQRLRPQDFAFDHHRHIFEAMAEVARQGQVIDTLTLQARLAEHGALEKVGGVAYIACLDVDLPDPTRIDAYLEIVRDRALRRRLSSLGLHLARQAFDPGASGREVVGRLEARVLQMSEGLTSARLEPIGEVVDATVEAVEEEPGSALPELRWGLPTLDRILGGLGRGRMVVLAGRPGYGKTSLALAVCRELAAVQARTVALFSLEMTNRELALRLLGSEAEVPAQRIASGILSRPEWERLHQSAARLRTAPLYVDDSSSLTLLELASTVRRLQSRQGLDAVVIDYLQLLDLGEPAQNETLALARISRGLKKLARELNVPVLVISQLSREPERRGPAARPKLSDLRGSGALEQDPDAVIFLWPPSELQEAVEGANLLAIVAKNRHGEAGEVGLRFTKETLVFEERPNPQETHS